jgi:hypothetical protein
VLHTFFTFKPLLRFDEVLLCYSPLVMHPRSKPRWSFYFVIGLLSWWSLLGYMTYFHGTILIGVHPPLLAHMLMLINHLVTIERLDYGFI